MTHIRDDGRTHETPNGATWWVALCGEVGPESSISRRMFEAIVVGLIVPLAPAVKVCGVCALTIPAESCECRTCGHRAKNHAAGRCRIKRCGCGGWA